VVITAGTLTVDGSILADGVRGAQSGGSGGSININTGAWTGAGTIRAAGGTANTGYGSGGGGRVAVRSTSTTFNLANVTAPGGVSGAMTGGAGTVFLKDDGQSYGDLIIDNKGTAGANTPFPTVGPGLTIGSATALTLTVPTANFPYNLAGVRLIVNNDTVHPYVVVSNTATTITVFNDPLNAPLTGAVGLPFYGNLQFDSITVRGKAKVTTTDRIQATTITVDTAGGSSLTAANYP
jgi:hypothetical protein